MADDFASLFEGDALGLGNGPLFPESVGEILHGLLHPTPAAQQDGPPWTHTFNLPPAEDTEPARCAHCGHPCLGEASVNGEQVCHTDWEQGVALAEQDDCYRLVILYGERLGSRRET